ncbi:MAG: integrase [Conexibacter sp.]|nr:integrase [Conexibacter sp.]
MSSSHATGAVALVSAGPAGADLSTNPIRNAHDLAAAFLAGYRQATREAYARDLRAWGAFLAGLGGIDPLDARRVHVEAWCRQQEEEGVAPATTGRRLSALSGFYEYAVDEELIDRSPVKRVRRPRVSAESPRTGVERDGMRALLAAAEASGPRDHALIAVLCLNGWRISETLALRVGDLGHERGHRTAALTRKGGKRQIVAIAPRAADAIDVLVAGRGLDEWVFATRSGRAVDRVAAAKTVARLARIAGIEDRVSPHRLRHGWVTLALDANVPLHVVQDGAGHADPRTTQRYNSHRHSLDRAAAYAVAAHLAA